MRNRVVFFGPLFEFFDSSIFQGVRILKILAPGQKKFNLLHPGLCWVRSCVPGVPDHLGTPQWSHKGLKLKICYKNDILRAFFVLWKIFFVFNFLDFSLSKLAIFCQFSRKLILHLIKGMCFQKKLKSQFKIKFWIKFVIDF